MRDDASPEPRARREAGQVAENVERAQLQERLGQLLDPALERLREPGVSGVAVRNECVVPGGHPGQG